MMSSTVPDRVNRWLGAATRERCAQLCACTEPLSVWQASRHAAHRGRRRKFVMTGQGVSRIRRHAATLGTRDAGPCGCSPSPRQFPAERGTNGDQALE